MNLDPPHALAPLDLAAAGPSLDLDGDPSAPSEPELPSATRQLMRAAAKGDARRVQALLSDSSGGAGGEATGADPKAADRRGWTALIHAARGGDLACVRALLPVSDARAKDQPDPYDDDQPGGQSALIHAAAGGHASCVLALLDASDARAVDAHGQTALMLATAHENAECVRALLSASDPHARDHYGWTALMRAAAGRGYAGQRADAEACVRALLPWSDPNARNGHDRRGATPLMIAACYDAGGIVRALLPVADVNARTGRRLGRKTALMDAAELGRAESLEALLSAPGLDVNLTYRVKVKNAAATERTREETALDLAIYCVRHNHSDLQAALRCVDLLAAHPDTPASARGKAIEAVGKKRLPATWARREAEVLAAALRPANPAANPEPEREAIEPANQAASAPQIRPKRRL
jgi:ankyrin repeat protein